MTYHQMMQPARVQSQRVKKGKGLEGGIKGVRGGGRLRRGWGGVKRGRGGLAVDKVATGHLVWGGLSPPLRRPDLPRLLDHIPKRLCEQLFVVFPVAEHCR